MVKINPATILKCHHLSGQKKVNTIWHIQVNLIALGLLICSIAEHMWILQIVTVLPKISIKNSFLIIKIIWTCRESAGVIRK